VGVSNKKRKAIAQSLREKLQQCFLSCFQQFGYFVVPAANKQASKQQLVYTHKNEVNWIITHAMM